VLTPTTKSGLDLGNGWLIRADSEIDDRYDFSSSDEPTAASRPKLTIVYTIPPVAAFSADVTSGDAPLTVQFTDASTNTPTSWDWDFGDGSSHSSDQNPTHEYTTAGTYTVTLTATNAAGNDDEVKTDYIMVTAVGGGGYNNRGLLSLAPGLL